jgi:lipopolysaccharide export system protein LptC
MAVTIAKRALPAVALILLSVVAFWPEIDREGAAARLAFRRGIAVPENGELTQPHFNGVDQHDRPYTVTARSARQTTQDRVDMVAPIGDMSLANGSWLRGEGARGVYITPTGQLDLQGNVTLYRDDGITLQTDTATLDVKSGAASSADKVHVEGPFGTLDAQGFTVLDHGSVVQFAGPARLLLNGSSPRPSK